LIYQQASCQRDSIENTNGGRKSPAVQWNRVVR